ncbi:BQ5605_C012g06728 [Microbotryum silenes-dioicae]|uniref:BQ5605_C012g06728 protein n=1 Tax=Microbotryum silenes-dioicae TaxID=796604 RepID=A0A2X0LS55_9BASI|nr:BQ5605_C012g06728 [Microbotryum silenes-dioicae]
MFSEVFQCTTENTYKSTPQTPHPDVQIGQKSPFFKTHIGLSFPGSWRHRLAARTRGRLGRESKGAAWAKTRGRLTRATLPRTDNMSPYPVRVTYETLLQNSDFGTLESIWYVETLQHQLTSGC